MQTQSRLFDEIAKVMTSAAGAAQGAARELESLIRAQIERLLGELDLVRRDEFDAVKDLAQAARRESEALKKRVDVLEAALAGKTTGARPARRRSARPGVNVKQRSRS